MSQELWTDVPEGIQSSPSVFRVIVETPEDLYFINYYCFPKDPLTKDLSLGEFNSLNGSNQKGHGLNIIHGLT